MKLSDLTEGISIFGTNADSQMEISGISYDSRQTNKGDLFVAITGYESDGHDFIRQASDKGAAAVLCQRIPDEDIPYVLVESTRSALASASANFFGHPARRMKMTAVTGTNGKTTVTYLMKSVLERTAGAKVGLIGTNQNMIGQRVLETERTTPESYDLQKLLCQMADEGCTHVVMEASSIALVLNRVDGVRFDCGIFTNLTQDHLDFHGTMEAYQVAKALLFDRCETGIFNLDDEASVKIMQSAACAKFTYSAKRNEADLVAKNIKLKSDKTEFEALQMMEIQHIELNIPGSFTVYNALAVICAVLSMGISLKEAAEALKQAKGVKGRVEVVPAGEGYTMLIDYAHTPDALENVLKSVKGFASGRVVTLFGCGGDRDRTKRPLMGAIAVKYSDFVIVTSDNPRTEEPMSIIEDIMQGVKTGRTQHAVIPDRREAIRYAMDNAKPGDVVILAGKGHETYQIIGKTKYPLDEREIIAGHLKS